MDDRNREWLYMDSLRPPTYVVLKRRHLHRTPVYVPLELDGRLAKPEWDHVPWSQVFEDIEGAARQARDHPKTHFKMMYDEQYLYIGAELIEEKIWGTITEQNSTMYDENDFEVFLNPDSSRHHYYELEMNCLNTIWELVLEKPYKDAYDIVNPYNLPHTKTAVYVDGVTNSPHAKCTKWSVEIALALEDLVQFDRWRQRRVEAGDVWRMNFSRVQYQLEAILDENTKQLQYAKVPNTKEDNIVWAPTGVIDIHRPEKWGYVLFASSTDYKQGEKEFEEALQGHLGLQIAVERILDAIYYDQRQFWQEHGAFAARLDLLYGKDENGQIQLPHRELLDEYDLSMPEILREPPPKPLASRSSQPRRSYVPQLDADDPPSPTEGNQASDPMPSIFTDPSKLPQYSIMIKSSSPMRKWYLDHDARFYQQ